MSEMDIYKILWLNYYKKLKSVGKMALMEIAAVLTCIETQKVH